MGGGGCCLGVFWVGFLCVCVGCFFLVFFVVVVVVFRGGGGGGLEEVITATPCKKKLTMVITCTNQ